MEAAAKQAGARPVKPPTAAGDASRLVLPALILYTRRFTSFGWGLNGGAWASPSQDRRIRPPVSPPSRNRSGLYGLGGLRAERLTSTEPEGPDHMPLYEHVFLARQDVTSQQVEEMTAQYTQVLTSQGGEVKKTEYWGVKPLAYRINKNRKAHYTLLNIDAPAAAVAEMERQMGISEDILRFMTIKVEELEEAPSAMLQRRDRDDRDDRPGGGRGGREGGGFRRDREDRPRRSESGQEAN